MKNYQSVEQEYFYDAVKGEKHLRRQSAIPKMSEVEREDLNDVYTLLEKPSVTEFIALILQVGFYGAIVFIFLLLMSYFPNLEIYVGNI